MNELDTPNETQLIRVDEQPVVFVKEFKQHAENLVGIKQCKRCNELRITESFSRNTRMPDGLQIWCRECVNEYGKTKRRKDKQRQRAMKTCRACKTQGHVSMFHKNTATRDGYSYDCKACRAVEYQKRAAKKRAEAVEMKVLEAAVNSPPPSIWNRVANWLFK